MVVSVSGQGFVHVQMAGMGNSVSKVCLTYSRCTSDVELYNNYLCVFLIPAQCLVQCWQGTCVGATQCACNDGWEGKLCDERMLYNVSLCVQRLAKISNPNMERKDYSSDTEKILAEPILQQ